MTRHAWLAIAVLIVLGLSLYAFNLKNPLFWDDDDWIINNPAVHSLSWSNIKFIFSHDTLAGIGLKSNYYRPFLFLTFLGNYVLSGTNPVSYHLVSNLIHIANAVLIFHLLDVWLKKRRAALIASLLFLVHPLQTEAVAYISGRGDPLSVLFMLLALTAFLKNKPFWAYGAAVLAILSRETAFLFPFYLTVFLAAFKHQERFLTSLKKSLWDSKIFFGISFFYGILRLTVLNFQNTLNFYHQANIYTEHLSYRIYTFFHVLAVYLRLIFWPTGLHMERDVAINVSIWQWPVWLGLLVVLSIFIFGIYLYKRDGGASSTKGQPRHWDVWFFSWGIFFVNLLPTSGVFPINALLYEHWLYFSLFGFFTLAAYYLDKISNRYVLGVGLAIYLAFFGYQTIQRNIIWGKTADFYEDVLKYEPANVRVLNNLANYYSDHGQLKKAEDLLWRAIDADDIQPAPYYNLGNILRGRKEYAGALELYKKALQTDPSFPYAYTNIAAIYAQQGNLSEAARYLEQLKSLQPANYEVYYNLGQVYQALGRLKEAKETLLQGRTYVNGNARLEALFNQKLSEIK